VLLIAEAGVDGPGSTSFADQLRVESRIHLNEQPGPLPTTFQIDRVRGDLAVERTALNEETIRLITPDTKATYYIVTLC